MTFSIGCEKENNDIGGESEIDLLDLIAPATKTDGANLVEVLGTLNTGLEARYPNHSHLPIIIDRHDHQPLDLGEERVDFDLPEQSLVERIQILSAGTMTHWSRSENGFIIFKIWHRPQYSWDSSPTAVTNRSEQGAAPNP